MDKDRCFPSGVVAVSVALACIDGAIATFALSQLIRMQMRNRQLGWTRQKVFHLMIGSSNVGYFIYFISTLVSTCKRWFCWSHACGFVLMACPTILFQATFLLLLSFWVDLCHQPNDEDEEDDDDDSCQESLLEKSKNVQGSHLDHHKKSSLFHFLHVGSRQKFVVMVVFAIFVTMIAFAALIWIGMGENPIDSSTVARVYIDVFAIAILVLAGALAVYGLLLFLKMSKIRSEMASSEMWKVAGLAVICFVCFTSSAVVALSTEIPLLYHWRPRDVNGVITSFLIILYYFIGSSIPSAFVLWVMRELPPAVAIHSEEQSSIVTYISDAPSITQNPQRWTTATSSQNQASRASPI
ncbi:hypothetical protein ACHQM5_004552 [Ranunculus cassubicifolius]